LLLNRMLMIVIVPSLVLISFKSRLLGAYLWHATCIFPSDILSKKKQLLRQLVPEAQDSRSIGVVVDGQRTACSVVMMPISNSTLDSSILILRCTVSPVGGVLGKEGHSALIQFKTYLRCEAIYYRTPGRYRNARDQCTIKVVSQVCPVIEIERALEA
jgi:hypothetical protein